MVLPFGAGFTGGGLLTRLDGLVARFYALPERVPEAGLPVLV